MHAGTVIAKNWLWHEGCGLAVSIGNLMHNILVDLHLVGVAHQRVELDAKLVLAAATSW